MFFNIFFFSLLNSIQEIHIKIFYKSPLKIQILKYSIKHLKLMEKKENTH